MYKEPFIVAVENQATFIEVVGKECIEIVEKEVVLAEGREIIEVHTTPDGIVNHALEFLVSLL